MSVPHRTRGAFRRRYCPIGPRPYVQPMRQLASDHELPFAADAIPVTIGLAMLAVVILVALIALLWPRSR